jgi:nucleoside 2-deoxyribosyltransferase
MPDQNLPDDHRLDILILGPMGNEGEQSSVLIGEAVKKILAEPLSQELRAATNTTGYAVHVPDQLGGTEIVKEVLTWLDIADLVIVNLTPRAGATSDVTSPNVYYELGLVHALGLPVILLAQEGTTIPFYFRTSRYVLVADFSPKALANALRGQLQRFLRSDGETDFTDNRITQFYGLPIVDISAAVGLATGYYHNFVGRLLRDGSFVSAYPDKVKHLIVVRPQNVLFTYEQDLKALNDLLAQEGLALQNEKLEEPPGDRNGPAWINHVDGIVVDLPRTIYPLKNSPRLLALRERLDRSGTSPQLRQQRDLMLRQHGANLVRRIEQAIKYHVLRERPGYREQLLHYASFSQVPALIRELSEPGS